MRLRTSLTEQRSGGRAPRGPGLLIVLSVLLAWGGVRASPEKLVIRWFPLPGHGRLELRVPESWSFQIDNTGPSQAPQLSFRPIIGDDFKMTILPEWSLTGDPDFNSRQRIRSYVVSECTPLLATYKESKLRLQKLEGPEAIGYLAWLTEKAEQRGRYRYLKQGCIGTGELLLRVTIQSHAERPLTVMQALETLKYASQVP